MKTHPSSERGHSCPLAFRLTLAVGVALLAMTLPPARAIEYVHSADAGTYSLVVTNASGSVTSAVARVTVTNSPPFVVTAPRSQYIGIPQRAKWEPEPSDFRRI
jgi:hypothetical protein